MSVLFVKQGDTLNLVFTEKSRSVQIDTSHPSYVQIKKALLAKASEDEVEKLLDVNESLKSYVETESNGKAVVKDGQVFFDGQPVHNVISERILQFMKEGLPFSHLLRFMEKCELNPSHKAKVELFDFLQHKSLPITDEGNFLAYKAINSDWTDKHTGKISNIIGAKPFMLRNKVDDDREVGCSSGFHAGSLQYCAEFGHAGDRLVIVLIDPKDVVSVPKDCNFQKLRCCTYTVVSEFTDELVKPLYNDRGEDTYDDYEDDDDDWNDLDDGYDDESDGYENDQDYDYDDDDDDWDDEEECDCDDCGDISCPDNPGYTKQAVQPSTGRDRYGRFAGSKVATTNPTPPRRDRNGRFV